jgi:hypothetical protein
MRKSLRFGFGVLSGRWLLLAMVATLALTGGSSLAAQTVVDPTSCGHFDTWEEAQAALEDPTTPNPENLDPDDDGVACESAFGVGDGDIPADQMSCSNFPDQAAAQAHYDATDSATQRDILDPDGDGTACEDAFDESGSEATAEPTAVAALPATGSGLAATSSSMAFFGVVAATLVIAAAAAYRTGAAPSR